MDSISPQDVYARHLISRRGYPLWTPEPSLTLPDVYREHGLKIGDVGVVVPEDGSFDVFFNICLSPTHSLHRQTGVPNNFNPIQLEERDVTIFPEAEAAGRIISTSSVTKLGGQSSSESASEVAQPGPLNYEFTLSSKEGALLILPEGAERYYLRNQRPFLEEAINHAVDWYNFAEDRLGRIISHDSLYLITGFYKAPSWSLAAYQQASGVGGTYAQFKAVQVGGGNITRNYSWEATHALDWRVGPSNQYYNGIANQSVFIQGFKIAIRSSILGMKRIKVKADFPAVGPYQVTYYNSLKLSTGSVGARSSSSRLSAPAANTSGNTVADWNAGDSEESPESDEDFGEDITIHHIPQAPKPFHPSDIINQWLLRSFPLAEIAITHDTQWSTLLESGSINAEEFMEEGRLESLLYNKFPVVRKGAIYLQNISSDSDADLNAFIYETADAQDASPTSVVEKSNVQVEALKKSPGHVKQESSQPDTSATSLGEVVEAEPNDSYKTVWCSADLPVGSTTSQKTVWQEGEITYTNGMFKKYQPPTTPKLSKLSLAEEPYAGSDSTIRKGSSTAGQPTVPLRSILKGQKSAQSRDSYKYGSEWPVIKKAIRSRYDIPILLPPGSRLVPMKQPAFDLHWQLLPYDPQRSRRYLRFDIAFPVDQIVFQDHSGRTKLSEAELNKPAANGTMTKMLITFEQGPFSWEVGVRNAHGIRCRDVFEAIYKTFNEQLTLEEQQMVRNRGAVDDAFRLRCKLAPGLPEVERSYGWKRVDVLLHQTVFLGLTQPKSGGDLVLILGDLPDLSGLS